MTTEELLMHIDQATQKKVTKLNLSKQNWTILPSEIAQLQNLTELDLRANHLTKLPAEIAHLQNLKVLYLSENQLTTLPAEIAQLQNLTELHLSENQLKTMPVEIVQLQHLTRLYFCENLIKTLPAEIAQLQNLTELYLSENLIKTLPAEIAQLQNLKVLDLRENQLTTLPAEIAQLQNLTELYLRENQVSSLTPEVTQLHNLTVLDLCSNQLKALPVEISHLQNLTRLSLSVNQLKDLPLEISHLKNLKVLDLFGNHLRELPTEISLLQKLARLDLSENRLPIPPEIASNIYNSQQIIDYYLQIRVPKTQQLNEAKMLVVGQSKVGKTSLVNRLVHNHFDRHKSKTEGIKITNWSISGKAQTIQLNVWDFGGQEIMHATHQFFLTQRSFYLLVIDTRLDEGENRIEYWLKIIQSFGGDSPIIIVGNQCDEHPLDIDQRGLQDRYPQIKAILETSCLNGTGIDTLKRAIAYEIGKINHVFDQLPGPWFQVKKQLEQMESNFIPYTDYERLCESEDITQGQNQRTLVSFLHDLGVVLNFQDDPRLEDTHVLKPEWVTNGVYKILNDRTLIIETKGILDRSELNRILDPQKYPRSKHLFILDMMRKFELCFPLEGFSDKRYLIPDLLSKEEPYTGNWQDTLAFEYHYNVLPSSILSRFIVRMNEHIHHRTYWRTGVVLAYDDNTALVRSEPANNKIFIRISGPPTSRQNMLTVIRREFDAIHHTIKGIKAHPKVPIPNNLDIVVDYQHLLTLSKLRQTIFIPEGLDEEVSVQNLLKGIDPTPKQQDLIRALDKDPDLRRIGRGGQTQRGSLRKDEPLKKSVYLSYAWGGSSENMANQIDAALQARGIPMLRDKRDIGFKGPIKDFMKDLSQGKAIVVVISEKYLKSENCMFELVHIAQNGAFADRIFPIILSDAKIYKAIHRARYAKHWESEINELDAAIKDLGSTANTQSLQKDLNLYTDIRGVIDQLADILSDMNALTPDLHQESEFSELIKAIEQKLAE